MPEPMAPYSRFHSDGSGRFKRDSNNAGPPKPTKGQSAVEYVLFGVLGVLLIVAGFALWSQYNPKHRTVPNRMAQGIAADRINILLIGIGGDAHPGGGKDMADAILLVSLKPSTRQASIISVPRDLWVRVGGYGTHRLTRAHTIGNQGGYPGGGPGLVADTVSRVFGQPVHAFVRIDFAAFEKVIDDLGGVDVYNPRAFHDYLFNDGFNQGWQHLNGKRALAYARYRYVRASADGNNFARELRQQQIIGAIVDKLQRRDPADVARLMRAIKTLSRYTDTNLTTADMWKLYRTYHNMRVADVRHVSLKPLTEVFNVTRLGDPGEAVRPRTGDFAEIQLVARNIFSESTPIVTRDLIALASAPPARPRQPHVTRD